MEIFNKFRKDIALSIYSNPKGGFHGYDDAALKCEKTHNEALLKIINDLNKIIDKHNVETIELIINYLNEKEALLKSK